MRELLEVIVKAHRAASWREIAKDAIGAIAIAVVFWLLCQIPR